MPPQPRSPGRPASRMSTAEPMTTPSRSLPLKQSFQWQDSTMSEPARVPSVRQSELLELAYGYALAHGLADLSLRPLAAAIGSSAPLLPFLFGSKANPIRARFGRSRSDEMAMLAELRTTPPDADLAIVAAHVW